MLLRCVGLLSFLLPLQIFAGYKDVTKGLYDGHGYSWTVVPAKCKLESGDASIAKSTRYASSIDNWEDFYDERFSPIPYFATSAESLQFDVSGKGKPYYQFSTLRVYSDDHVTLTIDLVDTVETNWNSTATAVFSCDMNADDQVKLERRDNTNKMLCSAQEIMMALNSGSHVRYVTEYAKCDIDSEDGMGATGGSNLDSMYEVLATADGEGEILWNRRTLIQNYQGSGYCYDVVEGSMQASTGIVKLTASDILVGTYEPEYVETFTCSVGCGPENGFKVYQQLR